MKLYNSFAKELKDFRSLVMFLNTMGWGYVEYHLVSYFMEVFNLYLKSNHPEIVTPIIGLGILCLIGIITIVLYQGASTLVLIFKENIKPTNENGLRWNLQLFTGLGIIFPIVIITFTRFFGGWEKVDTSWGWFLSYYAILLLGGLIWGLCSEFRPLKVNKVNNKC